MQHITAGQIARAVGGQILCGNPDTPVTDICTDSRQAKTGDLYVPILGERVDGHLFIEGALKNGAAAVFTSRHTSEEDVPTGEWVSAEKETDANPVVPVWIHVADTRAALQALGRYCRSRLHIPFAGVTGSVGKTSTRAMIAAALSAGFHTFQTAGNANSQVGVPITLSRVSDEYEAAVIELGMSEPGEMTRIAAGTGLQAAVITNIGISHIEQLGSQANILREKLHITDGLTEDGWLILNGDDPYLYSTEPLPELDVCVKKYKTRYYGIDEHNDYRADNIQVCDGKTMFILRYHGGEIPVTLPVIGIHHVRNALAALACADALGVSVNKAAGALAGFGGVAHRQERIEFPSMDLSVIDDSYNASPDSMRAAITALQMMTTRGRKLAVLADMWELGPDTLTYHHQVGQALGASDTDVLITVGTLAKEIAKGALEMNPGLQVVSFEDRFGAAAWLEENRKPGDLILLKGSNGMKLFEIVDRWKQNGRT